MTELAHPSLAEWESFYVIVGSSGAALIGLQFVVMTLIAGLPARPSAATLSAFGTPTVVHLSSALLVSAVMSAPWHSFFPASETLGLCGLGGILYGAVVVRRARAQTGYEPVWQDWLWFAALPWGTYAALGLGALLLRADTEKALFVIAASALGLLLIGIHNAWDTLTHIVFVESQKTAGRETKEAAAKRK